MLHERGSRRLKYILDDDDDVNKTGLRERSSERSNLGSCPHIFVEIWGSLSR
jgi:hypothetical protein